jgi:hypothetical protein
MTTKWRVEVYRNEVGAGQARTGQTMQQAFDAAIKSCSTSFLTGISGATRMRYGPDIIQELEGCFHRAQSAMMKRVPKLQYAEAKTDNARVVIRRTN